MLHCWSQYQRKEFVMDKPHSNAAQEPLSKMNIKGLEEAQLPSHTQHTRPTSRVTHICRILMFSTVLVLTLMRWVAPYLSLEILKSTKVDYGSPPSSSAKKPNFIFIMTDDQDLHMNSVDYQPVIQREFAEQGTFFSKHFCTIAICCPSRVSLLTGKAAHNTNVTDVSLPYGGYPKFVSEGWNERYLPIWLQEAGYNTYYTGKLMNGHSIATYNDPFPKGWNGTDYLIDPGTYIYYNSTMQRNQDPPRWNPDEYSTDLVAASAVGYLNEAREADAPFFLGVAPIAPHAETLHFEDGGIAFYDPVPAHRHKYLFPDLKVPRTPNFNPDEQAGHGGFIKGLEKQNDTVVAYNDGFYRARIQSLQAVDDLVQSIMDWLYAHPDILENTYLMYTTDNGFHIGQHRLPPGKTCAIEEDINIPFFVRGPGIEKGAQVSFPTTHTDIVPTLFELAGLPLRKEFDGEPIAVTTKMQQDRPKKSEHVNVEFWGVGIFEGEYTPVGDDLEPNLGLISGK